MLCACINSYEPLCSCNITGHVHKYSSGRDVARNIIISKNPFPHLMINNLVSAKVILMPKPHTCPVCDGVNSALFKNGQNSDVNISVLECKDCGLMYLRPSSPLNFSQFPLSLFQDDWKTLNPMNVNYQYNRFMNYVLKFSPTLASKHDHSVLLDIGCGAGYFLSHARSHNWKVIGVDPWVELSTWGEKYLKVKIMPNKFEDCSLDVASVDVITLMDVIREPLI